MTLNLPTRDLTDGNPYWIPIIRESVSAAGVPEQVYSTPADLARDIPNKTVGNKVIWFGDSISAANGGTSISGQPISAQYDSKGFGNWANVMLNWSLEVKGNAGVGGEGAQQGFARINQVLGVESDWVVVLFGTNGASTDNTTFYLEQIYTTLINNGRRVAACTIPPSVGSTAGVQQQRTEINHWIRSYARKTSGIVLADIAAGVIDSAGSGFSVLANAVHDGTHFTSFGAMRAGRILADAMRPFVSTANNKLTHLGDYTNFMPNPLVEGAGTARPASWSGTGTATFSYVSRTDGISGKWFQTVVTAGNNSISTSNANLGGALAVGATVVGLVEMECNGVGAGRNATMYIQCWNGSTFIARAHCLYQDAGVTFGDAAYPISRGVFETPPLLIPSGTTLVQMVLETYEGTWRFSRASLRLAN